ncbi:MAG: bifunctional DNA-formamidopyrimidine glycosylase/DNA-(apurinic or apyrimidinic site) lyase [Bacillota bacterium]|nr:bifunctional DNA-formamidopyrimidine glycosylase/DNA-(apurinic or apyrimidinic site) lyase [Bacillota bacterium]
MPELPEVEHVVRSLRPQVVGEGIQDVRVLSPHVVVAGPFLGALQGKMLHSLERRGKFIVAEAEGSLRLGFHLRMTGRLLYREGPPFPEGHLHLHIPLTKGHLLFWDQRKFGRFYVVGPGEKAPWDDLGPDPFAAGEELVQVWRGRKAPIKALLLNQRLLAGVGNIYADEALFRAGLHPGRPGQSLGPEEGGRLLQSLRQVLREALDAGGTTFRHFQNGLGEEGRFAGELKVYGRRGEPCVRCGTPLRREVWAGRGSTFCPRCQH